MDSWKEYERWCREAQSPDLQAELSVMAGDEAEIAGRFGTELAFGTGGLRGLLGAGTNRINVYTVGKASQGLSDYLLEKREAPQVCIAYDSRRMSRELAERAAGVFCFNGIRVSMFDTLHPTPMLSYAVRHLDADAGVVITASHNPEKYNGYKVYGAGGVQITDRMAAEISRKIGARDAFRDGKTLPLLEAAEKGLFRYISRDVDEAYYEKVQGLVLRRKMVGEHAGTLKIVYSPLNGTGNVPVRRVLSDLGYRQIRMVEAQEKPDGNFPTTPRPDPGEPKVFRLAAALAEQEDADLILATDPDCDRVGAMARNHRGEYEAITGNQMGALLCDYIIRARLELGTMPSNPAVVKTVVTTDLGKRICEMHGVHLEEVLTGFKYIGELAERWAQTGEYQFLFGFEESYGCLAGDFVRDKDGVIAAVLIAELTLYHRLRGETLWDALEKLYETYGWGLEKQLSIQLEGAVDRSEAERRMATLRNNWTSVFGKMPVYMEDYRASLRFFSNGEQARLKLPESNVLKIVFQDGTKFVVRPSGTEPKLKLYLFAENAEKEKAEQRLSALEHTVRRVFA